MPQLQGAEGRIKQEKRSKLISPPLGSTRKVYAGISGTNSHKHWVIKNNKTLHLARHGIITWMSSTFVVVPYWLLFISLMFSPAKLSHVSDIWRTFGAKCIFWRRRRGWKERGPLLLFNPLCPHGIGYAIATKVLLSSISCQQASFLLTIWLVAPSPAAKPGRTPIKANTLSFALLGFLTFPPHFWVLKHVACHHPPDKKRTKRVWCGAPVHGFYQNKAHYRTPSYALWFIRVRIPCICLIFYIFWKGFFRALGAKDVLVLYILRVRSITLFFYCKNSVVVVGGGGSEASGRLQARNPNYPTSFQLHLIITLEQGGDLKSHKVGHKNVPVLAFKFHWNFMAIVHTVFIMYQGKVFTFQ